MNPPQSLKTMEDAHKLLSPLLISFPMPFLFFLASSYWHHLLAEKGRKDQAPSPLSLSSFFFFFLFPALKTHIKNPNPRKISISVLSGRENHWKIRSLGLQISLEQGQISDLRSILVGHWFRCFFPSDLTISRVSISFPRDLLGFLSHSLAYARFLVKIRVFERSTSEDDEHGKRRRIDPYPWGLEW